MTTISNNNIARAIHSATKGKNDAEQSLIFTKVIQFLFRRRLLSKAPDILLHLNKVINDEEGRITAKISSKSKLDEKIKKELAHALTKRYSVKEVVLSEVLDEKLLGGFKVEINDEVIDLTIKNKIGKLQEYLISSA
ncbi:MAG: F0F1 ATP synthase subunit delta [Patescibacteria group bacterium]